MFIQSKKHLIADRLHCIDRGIDLYSSKYDNFVVLGDLNTEVLIHLWNNYVCIIQFKKPH